MFEIAPSEEVGDFEVKAKFMGVEMEKVQLHFQVKHTSWLTFSNNGSFRCMSTCISNIMVNVINKPFLAYYNTLVK